MGPPICPVGGQGVGRSYFKGFRVKNRVLKSIFCPFWPIFGPICPKKASSWPSLALAEQGHIALSRDRSAQAMVDEAETFAKELGAGSDSNLGASSILSATGLDQATLR